MCDNDRTLFILENNMHVCSVCRSEQQITQVNNNFCYYFCNICSGRSVYKQGTMFSANQKRLFVIKIGK